MEGPPGVGASHGLEDGVAAVVLDQAGREADGVREPASKEWKFPAPP
jgi:hypothetical protein